ncbi:MAG: SDR family oxidoreductase [Dehalococcoidia bacterium]
MANVLEEKVAIVTGAGRGIGRGVALLMAQEGARVVVNDIGASLDGTGFDQGPADQVVQEIQAAGGVAVASYDSVATMEGGERIVRTALDHFGRLDVLVTPHGILRDRMVFNMTEEEWDEVIQVHLKGTFTVVKHACIVMRQQRSGRIITFTSESGLVGNSGQANYGAAKSGIAGLTKVVARDMGRYGVTVNSIAPRASTRMTAAVPDAVRQMRVERGIQGVVEEAQQFQQWEPEAVAPLVVYLASDYAAGVNGQTFLAYGGVIALMSQPRLTRCIFKEGRWTPEELAERCPQYLTAGLPNPSPPQALYQTQPAGGSSDG